MSKQTRRNVHVVPAGTSKSKRATFVARVAKEGTVLTEPTTQVEAIAAVIPAARKRRSEVVIHRADGRIRDTDSCGNDSAAVKDTKH